MESKYFSNPFTDDDGDIFASKIDKAGGLVDETSVKRLQNHVTRLVEEIDDAVLGGSFPTDDFSVYTGLAGAALLHYMLSKRLGGLSSQQHLLIADKYIRSCCSSRALRGKRITFLCGDAGPLAINAAVSHRLGETSRMNDSIKKLGDLSRLALNDNDMPDELLYGRSGYLYALLFVRRELNAGADSSLFLLEIEAVCSQIIRAGQDLAKQNLIQHGPPLMWQWHDKMYLGAAHGVAGILHTLLMASNLAPSVASILESKIPQTLDWLLTQRHQLSGNLMSSVGSSSGDKLVQWCHGATALPHVLLRFADMFPGTDWAKRYSTAAIESTSVVWQRGLLTKGYGICHGTAGNAYVFLAAYRATGDRRQLSRAFKFAEWCMTTEQRKTSRHPDRPFSLFEGSAGTAWFLADLLLGPVQNATFPAFELLPTS